MKKVQVIPAMDLMDGHCVRLKGGDFAERTNYSADPVQIAKSLEAAGFTRLHMVDLDGARSGVPKHLSTLAEVAAATPLIIDYSGGVKRDEDVQAVFDHGAALVAIGSVAVKDKPLFFKWIEKYGAEKILLGVDVRNEKLAISGWLEQTDIDLFDFLTEMTGKGIRQVFCTDISKDGMMSGPASLLYRKIIRSFPNIKLIASGGVSSPEQLQELANTGCTGAIVGKAIYEDFTNLTKWLE